MLSSASMESPEVIPKTQSLGITGREGSTSNIGTIIAAPSVSPALGPDWFPAPPQADSAENTVQTAKKDRIRRT